MNICIIKHRGYILLCGTKPELKSIHNSSFSVSVCIWIFLFVLIFLLLSVCGVSKVGIRQANGAMCLHSYIRSVLSHAMSDSQRNSAFMEWTKTEKSRHAEGNWWWRFLHSPLHAVCIICAISWHRLKLNPIKAFEGAHCDSNFVQWMTLLWNRIEVPLNDAMNCTQSMLFFQSFRFNKMQKEKRHSSFFGGSLA